MIGARFGGTVVMLIAALAAAAAQAPGAETDEAIVRSARAEGKVVVYAATDAAAVHALLDDFRRAYPEVALEYHDMHTAELNRRFLEEAGAGGGSADVLWSSAMDLQIKLANDGYAAEYHSPAARRLPAWAVWKGEAYGTTFEPIGFVYNRRLLTGPDVPRSHADLAQRVAAAPERWRGRIGSYDPRRSGIGFLAITQDAKTDPSFAETLRAYGEARLQVFDTTAEMLDQVHSGDLLVAVNVIGSYALARAGVDPDLAFELPRDYTLVMSRIALIPKAARHPNAARLFLDYLLSRRGQEILAREENLFAIRAGITGRFTAEQLERDAKDRLYPIVVGPSLLVYLDQEKRRQFLERWERTVLSGRGDAEKPLR
jgi:iron(III) transport system substrate-binding protein